MDEDVRGAGGQHPRSARWFARVPRAREVGRGVREALVAVLALPHTSCAVIWGRVELIEWRRRFGAIARTIVGIFAFCEKNLHCPDMGRLKPSSLVGLYVK